MNILIVLQLLMCALPVTSRFVVQPTPEENDVNITTVMEYVESMQKTVSELTTNLTSALQELNAYDTKMTDLTALTDELKDRLKFTHVYDSRILESLGKTSRAVNFQAHIQKNAPTYEDNEILAFSNVRVNNGRAYNSTSGIFTAPISGNYLVWCNIINLHAINYMSVSLYKDTRPTAHAVAPPYVYEGNASLTTVLFLKKGQTIHFRLFKGSGNFHPWSHFGASLITL